MMYPFMNGLLRKAVVVIACVVAWGAYSAAQAQENDQSQVIKGVVQNQDLRRVPQAVVEVKNQEGEVVS